MSDDKRIKQVIVMHHDVKMRRGKQIAQGDHPGPAAERHAPQPRLFLPKSESVRPNMRTYSSNDRPQGTI